MVLAASRTAFWSSSISRFLCSASRRSSARFSARSAASRMRACRRSSTSNLRTLASSIATRAFSLRWTSCGDKPSSACTSSSVPRSGSRGPTKALMSTEGRPSFFLLSGLASAPFCFCCRFFFFLSMLPGLPLALSSSSSSSSMDPRERTIHRRKPPDDSEGSSSLVSLPSPDVLFLLSRFRFVLLLEAVTTATTRLSSPSSSLSPRRKNPRLRWDGSLPPPSPCLPCSTSSLASSSLLPPPRPNHPFLLLLLLSADMPSSLLLYSFAIRIANDRRRRVKGSNGRGAASSIRLLSFRCSKMSTGVGVHRPRPRKSPLSRKAQIDGHRAASHLGADDRASAAARREPCAVRRILRRRLVRIRPEPEVCAIVVPSSGSKKGRRQRPSGLRLVTLISAAS